MTLVPISTLLAISPLVLIGLTSWTLDRRREPVSVPVLLWAARILIVFLGLAVATSDTPWMPAEKVTAGSGRQYVGYILKTDNGSFAVMDLRSRKVDHIRDAIVSRDICEAPVDLKFIVGWKTVSTWIRRTPIAILNAESQPSYAPCSPLEWP